MEARPLSLSLPLLKSIPGHLFAYVVILLLLRSLALLLSCSLAPFLSLHLAITCYSVLCSVVYYSSICSSIIFAIPYLQPPWTLSRHLRYLLLSSLGIPAHFRILPWSTSPLVLASLWPCLSGRDNLPAQPKPSPPSRPPTL